jgi:hypothetical protein
MSAGIRNRTSKYSIAFVVALAGVIVAAPADAQSAGGGPPPALHCDSPARIAPLFLSETDPFENNADCMAWQDFIYLMWPAKADERGVADPARKLGATGPTVWETYRTVDTVFLPGGRDPGPWQQPQLMATLAPSLAQQVASGAVRHLTMTSKISGAVLTNILRSKAAIPAPILDEIAQAGGGTLYDLNGYPVYYQVAIDQPEYDYIRKNQLYNADQQANYARTHVIALPAGSQSTTQSATGAVEIKAAWKVLSDAERQSGRFHTIQALLGGSTTPVTVGLVGFHVFITNGIRGGSQGAWATFAQVDNAPIQPVKSGTFNFFNPKCTVSGTSAPCPVNVKDADPGQVVQITADAVIADKLNSYMQSILKTYDATSPWQYYKLIDVQWPQHPQNISTIKPPASAPLPDGTPNVPLPNKDMVNPVIETFAQQPGLACLTCHQYASTSAMGPHQSASYATSYSFIFGRATALAAGQP